MMKDLQFEIIGNILIIRETAEDKILRDFAIKKMKKHTYLKTAVLQTSAVQGQERTRELTYILGDENLETLHKEHGCQYLLDPSYTFFSPRLSFERQRIAELTNNNEVIINFFAGVGPFSIAIAKKKSGCLIHSIEINERSYKYLIKNISLNNCTKNVYPYLGDAFEIVKNHFLSSSDRILLPLPLESDRALPLAYKSLKDGKGTIHWQITEHLFSKEIDKGVIENKVDEILLRENITPEYEIKNMRIIRWIATRIAHIAVDLGFQN